MTFCLLAPQPAYWHDNLFIGMTTCLLVRQCEKSSMTKTIYTYTNTDTRTMFTGTTIYHDILVTLWNYHNPYMTKTFPPFNWKYTTTTHFAQSGYNVGIYAYMYHVQ